jgi:RNA polymerase sigma factor (sigma-70 family)
MNGESTAYHKAFETHVYLPHKDAIYRSALRKIGSPSSAEDIVQEVFVRAFSGLAALSDPSKISEWLNRIAANVIADHYRAHYMAAKHQEGIRQTLSDRPEDRAETLRQIVRSEIEKLQQDLRDTLLMSYEDGLSAREIGQRLQISEGTVRWRHSEGRRLLKEKLLQRLQDAPDLQGVLGTLVGAP